MKLVLLGTTGYHPNDRRHTACLLLPECGVMLDAGTAVYRASRFLRTTELDIFLTHAHLDHCVGLTFLYDVNFAHPLSRVTVHGEPDKLQAIQEHLFAELLFPAAPPCQFQPLAVETPLAGQGRLTHFALCHPGGTIGYRLDWPGHSMAYVTDVTAQPEASYVECLRDVDLLVHECTFSDAGREWAEKTGHSYTSAVAQVARRANVKRLVLVHLDSRSVADDPVGLETARAIFPPTELGEDLRELEF